MRALTLLNLVKFTGIKADYRLRDEGPPFVVLESVSRDGRTDGRRSADRGGDRGGGRAICLS